MFNPIVAMHLPDGFLSVPVALVGWFLAVVLLGIASVYVREQFGERRIPVVGVLAAFIFAAQMLNFPIPGGTSGHLIGAVLAAIILGPWAATLTMAAVIVIQALLFQDGGILAMGFNLVNMGILSAFVGYSAYRWLLRVNPNFYSQTIATAVGAWLGVVIPSIAVALQLSFSQTASLSVALPAMVGIHAIIGIVEAAITVAVLQFIRQAKPDLLTDNIKNSGKAQWIAVATVIILALNLMAPLASSDPDGLERVAIDQGFIDAESESSYQIMPDYTIPFIAEPALTTIGAAIIGGGVVAVISYGIAVLLKGSKRGKSSV